MEQTGGTCGVPQSGQAEGKCAARRDARNPRRRADPDPDQKDLREEAKYVSQVGPNGGKYECEAEMEGICGCEIRWHGVVEGSDDLHEFPCR